jgi:hypothetical protein
MSVGFKGVIGQIYDTDVLYKTATIYRLFGHDVEFEEYPTNTSVWPVVPSRECVPDVGSIMFDPSRPVAMKIARNQARGYGHTYVLPNLFTLAHSMKTLVCTIETPMIEVYNDHERKIRCAPSVILTQVRRPITYKVKAAFSARPSVFQASRSTKVDVNFRPRLPPIPDLIPATKPQAKGATLIQGAEPGAVDMPIIDPAQVPPDI